MKERYFVMAALLLVALSAAACSTKNTLLPLDASTTTAMDQNTMDQGTMDQGTMDQGTMDHEDMVVEENSHDHDHGEMVDVSGVANPPEVSVTATPDGTGGATLDIATSNFTLVPANPPSDHQPGEGHLHIYVDGVSIAMVHETTVHLGDLSDGHHNIRVTVSTNDHRDYTLGETVIAASTEVMTTGGTAAQEADHTLALEVMDGMVMGGIQRLAVSVGEVVAITATSDTDDSLHIHAYDLTLELKAGQPSTLFVEASIPGVFEGELHHAGFQVLSLEVS